LWLCKIGWDEPVQDDLLKDWLEIVSDLKTVSELSVRRCYFSTVVDQPVLHSFADASMKAYGAVVFLTQGNEVSFIMAKSRVAPLKQLTLPCLELIAATCLTRFVMDSISLKILPLLSGQTDCAALDKESEATSSVCPRLSATV